MATPPRRGDSLPDDHPRKGEFHGNAEDPDSTVHGGRPSRDRVLLDAAALFASRGTCSRAQVGAVIARDGRIITTGYNGAPSGMPHCDHSTPHLHFEPVGKLTYQQREEIRMGWTPLVQDNVPVSTGCTVAEHAERNAIAYAARYGLGTDQSTLYSTHAPCVDCARAIINAGIVRVVYSIPYRLIEGLELLRQAGVEIVHMPS